MPPLTWQLVVVLLLLLLITVCVGASLFSFSMAAWQWYDRRRWHRQAMKQWEREAQNLRWFGIPHTNDSGDTLH